MTPNITSTIEFKSRYGSMQVELVGGYRPIRNLYGKDLDPSLLFSISDAEKITLITEESRTQVCLAGTDLKRFFLVHHDSPSTVAVCRVVKIDLKPRVNAREVLARPSSAYGYQGPIAGQQQ